MRILFRLRRSARLRRACCTAPHLTFSRLQISILAPSKLAVLSNMGYLNGQKPEPVGASLLLHKFEPSVVMSSYLVAFVIGNFVAIEKKVTQAKTSHQPQPADVLVRVWGTPANAAKLQYVALELQFVLITCCQGTRSMPPPS
jgi:aminopeptidase N